MAAEAAQSEPTPRLQVEALDSSSVGDGEGSSMAADGSELGFDVGAAATGAGLVGTSPPPGVWREVGAGVATSCGAGVGPIDAETGLGASGVGPEVGPEVGSEVGASVSTSCGGTVGPIVGPIDAETGLGVPGVGPEVGARVSTSCGGTGSKYRISVKEAFPSYTLV
jgi:hypothetical protein